MDEFERIKQAIMNDPMNASYTQEGIEPLFMASSKARILIIGQAPALQTQKNKQLFMDRSGARLREWLNVDEINFYESGLFAILPMDFYFPGSGKNGDLPPRPHFASQWHPPLLALMPHITLTIVIGKYAQNAVLPDAANTVTENVLNFEKFLPDYFPLVHPSPRNQIWIHKHPEFTSNVLPHLRKHIDNILSECL